MTKSFILKKTCPKCNKEVSEVSRLKIGKSEILKLSCNHLIPIEQFNLSEAHYSEPFPDGRKLLGYQIEGVKFTEQSGIRCLIADEQGLGKTIQALATIKHHKASLLPCLVTTKTKIKHQWLREIVGITGSRTVQVLSSSKDKALPGFDFYVITYDILKSESVFDYIEIKSLILDECQAIKNHLSGRAKAVQKIVTNHSIEHIIALSGTPIKNNAGEYFTILNLLRPSRFPELSRYLRNYCDSYETPFGYKVGGLSRPDWFFNDTKDFIIRRTKSEVLKDLPKLTRHFHHVELSDKNLASAYGKASKELEDLFYADEDENTTTAMIAVMTKMRQITGVSKVEAAVEFVTDHLLSTDRKIIVFVHHHIVRDMLIANLNNWLSDGGYLPALSLDGGMTSEKSDDVKMDFINSPDRKVLIASTLAAGEGLDGLQKVCSDAIMLERQWNPANEEQAEARLDRFGQETAVSITYMLASETIDEYFTELVEQKRAIVAGTLDNKIVQWESQDLMRELASILVSKGKKKWTL